MTPHKNFKDTLFLLIGDDSEPLKRRGWGTDETCLESLVLPNGNTQKKYLHRGSCFYFFEIEKTTKKIVNTGFEGSEKDCSIAP